LDLLAFLKKKSHFLMGPRSTGKSWLIRNQLKDAQVFDLSDWDIFIRFSKRPRAISEEITSSLVVIDEIQKIPGLLDEVHRLIETKNITFLLTGSSARKLRKEGVNLLAGRARTLPMYPLLASEIEDFDLEKYCSVGGLPMVYSSEDPWLDLKEYTQLYLKEEIYAESLVRKIDHYANFLDVIGHSSGQELNYQQIASNSEVPVRTVANFIEILKDTLIAYELLPYGKVTGKKSTKSRKIYLFDIGVANYLALRRETILAGSTNFGIAFEHFMIGEIRARIGYGQLDYKLTYWRTSDGTHEVDCIIGDEWAIEIKSSERYQDKMISSLFELKKNSKIKSYFLVMRDPTPREVHGIKVMYYLDFIKHLWGSVFN
jgi:predicted AAA+ superfamily ATPase